MMLDTDMLLELNKTSQFGQPAVSMIGRDARELVG
jgi:hypothetical protein